MRASSQLQLIGSVKGRSGRRPLFARAGVAAAAIAATVWSGELPGVRESSAGIAMARSGTPYPDMWLEDYTDYLDIIWDIYGCSPMPDESDAVSQSIHLVSCFDANSTPAGLSDADREGLKATIQQLYCMVTSDVSHLDNITRAATKSTLKLMFLGVGGNPLFMDLYCR